MPFAAFQDPHLEKAASPGEPQAQPESLWMNTFVLWLIVYGFHTGYAYFVMAGLATSVLCFLKKGCILFQKLQLVFE